MSRAPLAYNKGCFLASTAATIEPQIPGRDMVLSAAPEEKTPLLRVEQRDDVQGALVEPKVEPLRYSGCPLSTHFHSLTSRARSPDLSGDLANSKDDLQRVPRCLRSPVLRGERRFF